MIHSPIEIETGIFSRMSSHDRDVAEIAVAEIEARIVPQHQAEAFERRLVEAELLFQLGDEFGVEALRAAISGRSLATVAEIVLAAQHVASAAGETDRRRLAR